MALKGGGQDHVLPIRQIGGVVLHRLKRRTGQIGYAPLRVALGNGCDYRTTTRAGGTRSGGAGSRGLGGIGRNHARSVGHSRGTSGRVPHHLVGVATAGDERHIHS